MGRYYTGDIDGKFWFGLQPSDSANRFGVEGVAPEYLEYWFDEDNLSDVEEEIERIEGSLDVEKVEAFFNNNNGYNDEMLEKHGINNKELADFADLQLGKKIRDCIKQTGECSFTAEL